MRIRSTAALACILVTGLLAFCPAQTPATRPTTKAAPPKRLCTMACTVETADAQKGPILTVRITNESSLDVIFERREYLRDTELWITTIEGGCQDVPGSPATQPVPLTQISYRLALVKSGETYTQPLRLKDFYTLKAPGRYRVELERKGWVADPAQHQCPQFIVEAPPVEFSIP